MRSAPYYQDEVATLYGCDMLTVLEGLPPGSVDAIITDPPYSSGGRTAGERQRSTKEKYLSTESKQTYKDRLVDFAGDERDQRSYLRWMNLWMSDVVPALSDGGFVMLFTDWRQLPLVSDAVQVAGITWRGIVPWYKSNARRQPGKFANSCEYVVWGTKGPAPHLDIPGQPGLLQEPNVFYKNRVHVSQKPLGIMRQLVKATRPGGTVLDPFMGSGTTGVAALSEGRHFIGCEIVSEYQAVAEERIRQARNDQAN